jgi:hypothetical protein
MQVLSNCITLSVLRLVYAPSMSETVQWPGVESQYNLHDSYACHDTHHSDHGRSPQRHPTCFTYPRPVWAFNGPQTQPGQLTGAIEQGGQIDREVERCKTDRVMIRGG